LDRAENTAVRRAGILDSGNHRLGRPGEGTRDMASARVSRIVALAGALLTLCLILGALSAAAADEPRGLEYHSSFGPDGTEATAFGALGSVAVDQSSGTVYLIDRSTESLYKFDGDGQPVAFGGSAAYISGNAITGLSLYGGANESQVAVDPATHTVYVTTSDDVIRAFHENGEPAEFTAGDGAGTSSLPVGGELLGVAVDGNGDIYASDYLGPIKVFASSGALITEFETERPDSLAVAPDGDLYVSAYSGLVRKFTPSEFPVTSATTYVPDPEHLEEAVSGAVAVDPVTSNVYVTEQVAQTGRVRVYSPNGTLLTTIGEAEYVGQVGVAVWGATGRVYLSTDVDDPTHGTSTWKVEIYAPEEIFVGAPTVVATSVSKVTADTATLAAQINPNTLATTYRFEYGTADCATSPCTAVPAAAAPAGSGRKPVIVSQPISGLEPGTTYHYRVIAENSADVTAGPDSTFVTQVGGLGFELSDSRAWEMVSPPQKFGGTIGASSAGITQAAENGDGIAYLTVGSLEREPEGSRAIEPASVLGRRGPDGAWQSEDMTVPHAAATGSLAVGSEYDLFDWNLGSGLLQPRDSTPLSDQASERGPYLRENTIPPRYTPLVTGKEGYANVPPGTVFGTGNRFEQLGAIDVRGANEALTDVALGSKVPLVAGAPPVGAGVQLYDWEAGQLLPISVLPAPEGSGIVEGVLGSEQGTVRHAISEDGTRVFWSPGNIGTGSVNFTGLYVRDPKAGESARLDVTEEDGSGEGAVSPMFQAASADGTVVYFTDPQRLTADASPTGRDLYRCELPKGPVASGCQSLIDVSAPATGSEESAEVQGLASGLSEDGSRVYFVAKGDLDAGAGSRGENSVAGEPNLYLWSEGEGLRFIATLSNEDDRSWGRVHGDTPGYEANLVADASPNGRYFTFMSLRSLTGAANIDASNGQAVEQVFLYDAQADSLACASCDPTGASPVGDFSPPHAVDLHGLWSGRLIGASLSEAAVSAGDQLARYPAYRPRVVHDNGRVFFNAVGGLVPADSNREWDVYQYEPRGVGGCDSGSAGAATSRSNDACLSLISSGAGEGDSAVFDASASGDDVFFLTRARLSVLDKDTVNDIYDARVNGIPATLSPVSECAGEACQHPNDQPDPPVSASEAFHSAGAALICPKGKRKVRGRGEVRCVRKQTHHRHRGHRRHQHQRGDHNVGTSR